MSGRRPFKLHRLAAALAIVLAVLTGAPARVEAQRRGRALRNSIPTRVGHFRSGRQMRLNAARHGLAAAAATSPQAANPQHQLQQLLQQHLGQGGALTPGAQQLLQAAVAAGLVPPQPQLGAPAAPSPPPAAAAPGRQPRGAPVRAAAPAAAQGGPILWPSRAQYLKAMQSGGNLHPRLQSAQLIRDARGFPMVASGSFSSAYRFRFANGKHLAVRVFHPPPQAGDRAKVAVWRERYQKLQRHFASVPPPPEIVEVTWLDDGVRVNGRSLPVTVMPWIEAQGLDDWVESNLTQAGGPEKLSRFAENFRTAMREMRAAKLAHGDLHHGNVLIERHTGTMRFIDYDAMWAPTLAGTQNDEIGHPNYQHPSYFHPQLRARPYGPDLDNFSALLIYLSAKALQHDPSLWQRFHRADDHLIFTHEDLRDPAASGVFQAVQASSSNTVRQLGAALARYCRAAPQTVPDLERAIALATGAPTSARPAGGGAGWMPPVNAPAPPPAPATARPAAPGGAQWMPPVTAPASPPPAGQAPAASSPAAASPPATPWYQGR